uniref:Uncharacterized protein n=1 Tax=Opuntia streptacantha TaxID=393608 RepID=A0A7C9A755_OPUST
MIGDKNIGKCMYRTAERAMLPSFDGRIGEIIVPDALIKAIGFQKKCSVYVYSRLHDHCQGFGAYTRFLRLPNVFCNVETCHLLTNSRLQGLLVRRICSKMHVDGLCKILYQNRETITSLQFVNCNISLDFFDAICDALAMEDSPIHGVKHFAVRSSKLIESNPVSLPPKLVSFLSSGSLESLSFCDDRIGRNYAKLTLMTILDTSSALSTLDLSDNNVGFRIFVLNLLIGLHCHVK